MSFLDLRTFIQSGVFDWERTILQKWRTFSGLQENEYRHTRQATATRGRVSALPVKPSPNTHHLPPELHDHAGQRHHKPESHRFLRHPQPGSYIRLYTTAIMFVGAPQSAICWPGTTWVALWAVSRILMDIHIILIMVDMDIMDTLRL